MLEMKAIISVNSARFQSLDGRVYVSHLEPKSDVIMLVGRHFADRMPSEYWMIVDDNRKTVCVHPKDGENYLRYLTDGEFEALRKTERVSKMNTLGCGRHFSIRSGSKSGRIMSVRGIFFRSGKESMLWNLKNNRRN